MADAAARPAARSRAVPAPSAARAGTELVGGRYRLVERVDVGATAEVWRAVDEDLDREVAVKLLHEHLLRDDVARRRIQREALAAARLSHPGIVTVYDALVSDERAAIVMELVHGETLRARLDREAPLPEAVAAALVADIAHALAHAHAEHLVHRDVKASNVLIDEHGRARLIDFGIARELEDEALRMTLTGTVVGTLHYLAPEQLAGSSASAASDVYSLGVVLYEALAGRPPYEVAHPAQLVTAQAHPPAPIQNVSPDLQAICFAALAVDPSARPEAAVLAASLDGLRTAASDGATRAVVLPLQRVRGASVAHRLAVDVSPARILAVALGAATGIIAMGILLMLLASLR